MAELIIDKSFLDAAPAREVLALFAAHAPVMTHELFYELMTTDEKSRTWCFRKFPDQINPIPLVPNVGYLMRLEAERKTPCTSLVKDQIPERFVFNRKLREGAYVFEGEVLKHVDEARAEVAQDTKGFSERCMIVHQFFPELSGIEVNRLPAAVSDARRKVASDVQFVRDTYASFIDEHAPAYAPDPAILSPDWAWFRWVQCQILGGLRIFGRYRGSVPADAGAPFWTRIEHTMLDVYYVIQGAITGAIATGDTEVQDDFHLVRPDGLLVLPSASQSGG